MAALKQCHNRQGRLDLLSGKTLQIRYNMSGWTGLILYKCSLETMSEQSGQHRHNVRTEMADKIQYVRLDMMSGQTCQISYNMSGWTVHLIYNCSFKTMSEQTG